MKLKFLNFSIFLSVVAILVWFLFFRGPNLQPKNLDKSSSTAAIGLNTFSKDKIPEQNLNKEQLSNEVSPQFIDYFRTESRKMDSPSIDQEKAQNEIQSQAEKMTSVELNYAKKIALNPKTPANEKILAIYLILKSKHSEQTLAEIVSAPLNQKANPEPDSIAESAAMQEKALRIMALDGLLQKASHDLKIRESLYEIAGKTSDPTIKNYLLKRLKELPN
jgi:hypothetical protein